jgi:2'-5' RNA ligase
VVVGGLGIFKNPGREVIYARVEDPTFALAEFRERVAELCRAAGVPPSEEFAWVPHVTLAERRLGVVAAPSAEVSPPPARSVRFNALHVFLGGVTEVMMLQWPGEPTLTGA